MFGPRALSSGLDLAALTRGYVEALSAVADVYDPLRLRAWWLGELRRLSSDYMRSPAFLALMKLNLTLLTRSAPPVRFTFPNN
jgi:hypothetical protein